MCIGVYATKARSTQTEQLRALLVKLGSRQNSDVSQPSQAHELVGDAAGVDYLRSVELWGLLLRNELGEYGCGVFGHRPLGLELRRAGLRGDRQG